MTDDELKHELAQEIEREEKALNSLIDFRNEYIPSKDDVTPASFHHE